MVDRYAVKEAVISSYAINKVLVQDGIKEQRIDDILKDARSQKLIIRAVPKSKLGFLADAPHQGVAALVAPYEYANFDEFLQKQKKKDSYSTVTILDGLEDPHNLGSILRTADVSSVGAVIIPKRRSIALTQITARASIGAIQHVSVIRVTDLSKTIDELKDNGFWIAGTETSNATGYRDLQADMSLGIVISSRGRGISRLVSDKRGFRIRVPMVGCVNSLSAFVAAGLMMYEVYRKRH